MLERAGEVAELAAAAREAAAGTGSVVLVFGEAGIGKSTLVEAVRTVLPPGGRLLVGYCDDLATPRTFGPFRDLVGAIGSELANAVKTSDRDRMFDALRRELSNIRQPAVLAVEDVHWADDATIDAVCYLVRRITDLPVVLLLTYRNDDLGPEHPLQRLLGQVARVPRVRRLGLARLSKTAVFQLTAPSRLDPSEVYDVTGGNPFFISEILASRNVREVPPTVVDAVLARVHALPRESVAALEQLAVIPSAVDIRLADSLLPDGLVVEPAEQRGLLEVSGNRVAFRHELIRRAVLDSIPVARRVTLNQQVLDVLVTRDEIEPARIVHHAAEAGDIEAISRYGPEAAGDAARVGSHRQAAAHLRLLLEQEPDDGRRADLLCSYAAECCTIGDLAAALEAQQEAVRLRRKLGDPRELGAALRWLSRIGWMAGEPDLMERTADEAISVLEEAGDDWLLAVALSNKSRQHMLAWRDRDAIQLGERAISLARTVDDPAVLSHALNNVGVSKWRLGSPEGRSLLEESLQVALSAGRIDEACRAYLNIVASLLENRLLAEARDYIAAAVDLAEDSEHLTYLYHLYMYRAAARFFSGDWAQAAVDAELAVNSQPPTRCPALALLGWIRVRRGEPGGDELLAMAWNLALQTRELHNTGLVAAALAETAWLHNTTAPMLEPVYAEACKLGAVAFRAELGYWLTRFGRPISPDPSGHPYALQAAGHWQRAATAWQQAGYPYEHAAALAQSPHPDDLLAALAILDDLGAVPLARWVRGQLRDLGVAHIPRGPAATTRENPAGLTDRQLEVARLLSEGLSNAQIAARLVISSRTVANHVSAVFDKLGIRNRHEINLGNTDDQR